MGVKTWEGGPSHPSAHKAPLADTSALPWGGSPASEDILSPFCNAFLPRRWQLLWGRPHLLPVLSQGLARLYGDGT